MTAVTMQSSIKNTSVLRIITVFKFHYREQRKLRLNSSLMGPSETVLNGKVSKTGSLRGYSESWFLLVLLLQHLVTSFRANFQFRIWTLCSKHSKKMCKPYVWVKAMEILGFIISKSLLILFVFWKTTKAFFSQEVFFLYWHDLAQIK